MSPRRILLLLVAVASCSDGTAPRGKLLDLAAAEQRWADRGPNTYDMRIEHQCFCFVREVRVSVINDAVALVLDTDTGQPVDVRLGETAESLFAFVRRAIENGAETIDVVYDPVLGYPRQIDYDGSTRIADDEGRILATILAPPALRRWTTR